MKCTRDWAGCDEGSGGAHFISKAWRDSAAVADHRHDRCQRRVPHGLPPPTAHAIAGKVFTGAGSVSEPREKIRASHQLASPSSGLISFRKKYFIRKVILHGALYLMKNPGTPRQPSTIVNRTVTPRRPAQRQSARAGISNPKGGRPPPGRRAQAFPVRPSRRDRYPDRLPSWATRQRTLRIDLEHDRAG